MYFTGRRKEWDSETEGEASAWLMRAGVGETPGVGTGPRRVHSRAGTGTERSNEKEKLTDAM
jgi:hypothetical protein